MGSRETKPGDLLQGTLDLLVLKTLARGAMHGYSLAEFTHETSEDVLRVEEGALYPALHRLSCGGCWFLNGACQRTIVALNITGSRQWGRNNCLRKQSTGAACPWDSAGL